MEILKISSVSDIAKQVFTDEEISKIDYAIPEHSFKELRILGLSEATFFVMDYNRSQFGRISNIAEMFLRKLATIVQRENKYLVIMEDTEINKVAELEEEILRLKRVMLDHNIIEVTNTIEG